MRCQLFELYIAYSAERQNEEWISKDMEASVVAPFKVLSRNLSEGTEEWHEKTSTAGPLAETWPRPKQFPTHHIKPSRTRSILCPEYGGLTWHIFSLTIVFDRVGQFSETWKQALCTHIPILNFIKRGQKMLLLYLCSAMNSYWGFDKRHFRVKKRVSVCCITAPAVVCRSRVFDRQLS